jgi:hypothetical protein
VAGYLHDDALKFVWLDVPISIYVKEAECLAETFSL